MSEADQVLEDPAPKTEQGGLGFDGSLTHSGFHLMETFQNWEFIMSYIHYLLKVDNLGVWADGRMCRVSHPMSGILQIYVLEAESDVTERKSVLSHISLIAAGSPLLWLPRFPS